jgi:hypothetical protein
MLHMARADQDRAAAPLASEAPRSLAWCTHKTVREYVVLGYNCPRPPQPRRAPRILVSGRTRSTSTLSCTETTRLRPHALYVDLVVRRDYSSPAARALRRPRRALRLLVSGRTRSTSTLPCTASTRLHSPGCSDLLRLRRASGCLGTSRGLSHGLMRRSSSTTPPRPGSSSTTSSSPRVRVPRHVARLVTRLVALLVVDYSASPRLVIDYFVFTVRLGASARRVARHTARRVARHRLLRLRRASGCLGTSRGSSRSSSCRSSSTTPPRAGSSSSTTLPPPHVRVPRHVARLVTRLVAPLVVDYSVRACGCSICKANWLISCYTHKSS